MYAKENRVSERRLPVWFVLTGACRKNSPKAVQGSKIWVMVVPTAQNFQSMIHINVMQELEISPKPLEHLCSDLHSTCQIWETLYYSHLTTPVA